MNKKTKSINHLLDKAVFFTQIDKGQTKEIRFAISNFNIVRIMDADCMFKINRLLLHGG